MRQISKVLLPILMTVTCLAQASLNYQQEITLTTFESAEATKKLALEFQEATENDPDIKVIHIKYEKLGSGESSQYNAILKCHVSKPDQDVLRIQEKMMQNNQDLKSL